MSSLWGEVSEVIEAGELFPGAISRPVTVKEALKGAPSYLVIYPDYDTKLGECCLKLRPEQSGKFLFGRNWGFQLIRLGGGMVVPTLSKATGASGFIHPSENRKISGGELKRFSSFPDSYRFKGTHSSVLSCTGNSVPPLLMRSIAVHIKAHILT